MTKNQFNVFIRAVNQFKAAQEPFAEGLLSCLNCKFQDNQDYETVRNWMGGKNKSFHKKFAGGSISKKEFDSCVNYLIDAVGHKFKEAQEKLQDPEIAYTLIDFETDDQTVFVKSLVYQLIEIFNLCLDNTVEPQAPRKKSPANKTLTDETPTDQMIRIFEQSVADYNLVLMVCNIADHIGSSPFYADDVSKFIDAMRTQIFNKFVNLQKEEAFLKIHEFTNALTAYAGCLGMLPEQHYLDSEDNFSAWGLPQGYYASSDDHTECNSFDIEDIPESKGEVQIDWAAYRLLWKTSHSHAFIYERISSDRIQLQDLASKAINAEKAKNNLAFLEQTFVNHEKLCRLYQEITGGKVLGMY